MAKTQIVLDTPDQVKQFVDARTGYVGAIMNLMQHGLSMADVADSVSKLRRNWGDISTLLAPTWAKCDTVAERCKVKSKTMSPPDWSDYVGKTKALALECFQEVLAFLPTLTLDLIASAPKATRSPREVKVAEWKIGEDTYTAQSIFTNPEFMFALGDKAKLQAFYTEHGASDAFKVAVWNQLRNVAEFKQVKKRKTASELQAMLDSGKNEAGKDLTDAQKAKLAERIAALNAKASEAVTTEPEASE